MLAVDDTRSEPPPGACAAAVASPLPLARPSESLAPQDIPGPECAKPYQMLLPLRRLACDPAIRTAHDRAPAPVRCVRQRQPGRLMEIADLPANTLHRFPLAYRQPLHHY